MDNRWIFLLLFIGVNVIFAPSIWQTVAACWVFSLGFIFLGKFKHKPVLEQVYNYGFSPDVVSFDHINKKHTTYCKAHFSFDIKVYRSDIQNVALSLYRPVSKSEETCKNPLDVIGKTGDNRSKWYTNNNCYYRINGSTSMSSYLPRNSNYTLVSIEAQWCEDETGPRTTLLETMRSFDTLSFKLHYEDEEGAEGTFDVPKFFNCASMISEIENFCIEDGN